MDRCISLVKHSGFVLTATAFVTASLCDCDCDCDCGCGCGCGCGCDCDCDCDCDCGCGCGCEAMTVTAAFLLIITRAPLHHDYRTLSRPSQSSGFLHQISPAQISNRQRRFLLTFPRVRQLSPNDNLGHIADIHRHAHTYILTRSQTHTHTIGQCALAYATLIAVSWSFSVP